MTKYIFLIGSEHQMSQVEYAKTHFNIDTKNMIIIIEKTHKNDGFITKLQKDALHWNLIIFESWVFKDLVTNRQIFKKFILICEIFKNQEIIFFASHYSTDSTLLFKSIVRPSQMYLMDEGNASFLVKAKRIKNSWKDKMKFLLKSVLYKKSIQLPKNLVYFTRFEFELPKKDQAVVYKTPQVQNPLKQLITNELSFIGSSIVELKMISEKDYLFFLQTIKAKHFPEIKIFKYYPHRKECPKKLELISRMGFEIVQIGEPFESWFSKKINVSEVLCSFYTTGVIYNIEGANHNVPKLIIYKFDSNLLKIHKKIYEDIYTTFKKNKKIIFETL